MSHKELSWRSEINRKTDMRSIWSILILVGYALAMTALFSCTDDNSVIPPEKLSTSYLPLQVGNYWEFKWIGATPNSSVIHREVVGKADLDGREYYLLTSREAPSQQWIDSVYYRVESNGDVYTLRKG